MYQQQHEFNSSCITGIMRRIICGRHCNSLSCNNRFKTDAIGLATKLDDVEEKKMKVASPSLVARLMGLDSMPVFPCTSPDHSSIKRSRSTSSVESLAGQIDSNSSTVLQMRRSSSFREVPTYLRQENEDFLVLTFGSEKKQNSLGFKKNRIESRKARNTKRNCKKENENDKIQSNLKDSETSSGRNDVSRKDGYLKTKKQIDAKVRVANKKLQISLLEDVEAECSSQDSSPISVLDQSYIDIEYSVNLHSPNSAEEELLKQQNSRRKLSSRFDDVNCLSPNFFIDATTPCGLKTTNHEQCKKSDKFEPVRPDCTQFWGKISTMIKEDVDKSTWLSSKICQIQEVEDMAATIEICILDILVQDAVIEIFNC